MTHEPFDSEQRQADRFDVWIDAAQGSSLPENDTVTELRALVELGRSMRADETFVRELEAKLVHLHRRKRRAGRGRWVRLAAAVALVLFVVLIAFYTQRDGQPSQTGGMVKPTGTPEPVALAATSTLAVQINQTQLATMQPTDTLEPGIASMTLAPSSTSTSTATVTATPTALPTNTLGPIGTSTPRFTATPAPSATATLLPLSTPTPASQPMTVIPAVNPTPIPATQPVIQLDVLLVLAADAVPSGAFAPLPGTRFGLMTVGAEMVDFTHDPVVFRAALQAAEPTTVDADTLSAALADAVSGVAWRAGATVKLIILVTDVAPSAGVLPTVQEAAAQGISIHVFASGELEESDALVLQQMAEATGGQLIKMTDSDDTLDDLIAQLLADELAARRDA